MLQNIGRKTGSGNFERQMGNQSLNYFGRYLLCQPIRKMQAFVQGSAGDSPGMARHQDEGGLRGNRPEGCLEGGCAGLHSGVSNVGLGLGRMRAV